jgi:trimeric autotransporter adhesin
MKTKTSLLLTILLGISFTAVTPVFSQGTAFIYQGLLTTSNGPVNGTYDLTFKLWDSLAGGNQVGNSITNPGWTVAGGQLTMPLDFGPTFSGAPLWLEIGVRTNGVGAFATLSPRQALTPTPYAIYAESATSLANGVAIGGGAGNVIVPGVLDSFIGGGNANNILDGSMNSAISGGMGNVVQGGAAFSFIGGGQNNRTFSGLSAIGGGQGNVVTNGTVGSTIGGGVMNANNASFATVAGGFANTASGVYAAIGGGSNNVASGYASVVGGGDPNWALGDFTVVLGGQNNIADGYNATVGGGANNHAAGNFSTIGGGEQNLVTGFEGTVAGGTQNSATAADSAVGGGYQNTASGQSATVGGGFQNLASGQYGTVPGGYLSKATGLASFAGGSKASADHDNSFVWSDGAAVFGDPFGFFHSSLPQQFRIQAGSGIEMDVAGSHGVNPAALFVNSGSLNGVGLFVVQSNSTDAAVVINSCGSRSSSTGGGDIIKGFGWTPGGFGNPNQLVFEVTVLGDVFGHSFTSISDRSAKENFVPVSPVKVLEKVSSLPISQWNFIGGQPDVQHIGPMAQDFHDAFGLNGPDDKHISLTDEGGVALAAIQGLNQKLEDQLKSRDAAIQQLKARLETLEHLINTTKGDE